MWFSKKPKYVFHHINEAIAEAHPILPISEVGMPWTDKSKKDFSAITKKFVNGGNQPATHRCSGIVNLMKTGWVLTAPMDVAVTTNGDGESLSWALPSNPHHINGNGYISHFGPEHCADLIGPPASLKSVLKLETNWTFHCTKGWGLLVLPLQYTGERRFTSSIGVLSNRGVNQLNAILFWHVMNGTTLIKAGTPLCQLFPIKLEETEAEVKEITKMDMGWRGKLNTLSQNKFIKNLRMIDKMYDTHKETSKCPVTRIIRKL